MLIHNPQELAQYVRNYRKKQNLSQSALALQIGLKQSTVSAFERKPEATKLKTLFKILSISQLELHVSHQGNRPDSRWEEEW